MADEHVRQVALLQRVEDRPVGHVGLYPVVTVIAVTAYCLCGWHAPTRTGEGAYDVALADLVSHRGDA